jgi:hypothetical protein
MTHFARAASLSIFLFGSVAPAYAGSLAERMARDVLGEEVEAESGEREGALHDAVRGCLECHDGSVGGHVAVKSAAEPLRFDRLANADHPVGMRYDDYYRRQPTRYRSRALLDPDIVLVDGVVTCVSCHRLTTDPGTRPGKREDGLASRAICPASSELTVARNLCMACHAL